MALLSSFSIAAVYLATEAERADVRVDGGAIAELYDKTVRGEYQSLRSAA